MDTLICVLVLWLVCSAAAVPFFLVHALVRDARKPPPRRSPGTVRRPVWTNDDEIAARHHH